MIGTVLSALRGTRVRGRLGGGFVYAAVLAGAASTWTLSTDQGTLLYTSAPATQSTITRIIATRDDTPARVLLVPRRTLVAGTPVTSNVVRLSGITVPVGIAVSGGAEISIDGGAWIAGPTVAERGQPIQLRALAPAAGQTVAITLTAGTETASWSLTALDSPGYTHQTLYGPWGACDADLPCAGEGNQTREILCLRSDGRFVEVGDCAPGLSPTQSRSCPSPAGQAACLTPPPGSSGWTQYCAAGSTTRSACTGSGCAAGFTLQDSSCVQSVFAACGANSAGDGSWTHPQLPHGGFAVDANRMTPPGLLPSFATAASDSARVTCQDGVALLDDLTTTATACVPSHKVVAGACVPQAACSADTAVGGWRHGDIGHGLTGAASRATPAGRLPPGAGAGQDAATLRCSDGAASVEGDITTTVTACAPGYAVAASGACGAILMAILTPDTVTEGGSFTLTVTAPAAALRTLSLPLALAADSVAQASDLGPLPDLILGAGETSVSVPLPTLVDAIWEGPETVRLILGPVADATLSGAAGDGRASVSATLAESIPADAVADPITLPAALLAPASSDVTSATARVTGLNQPVTVAITAGIGSWSLCGDSDCDQVLVDWRTTPWTGPVAGHWLRLRSRSGANSGDTAGLTVSLGTVPVAWTLRTGCVPGAVTLDFEGTVRSVAIPYGCNRVLAQLWGGGGGGMIHGGNGGVGNLGGGGGFVSATLTSPGAESLTVIVGGPGQPGRIRDSSHSGAGSGGYHGGGHGGGADFGGAYGGGGGGGATMVSRGGTPLAVAGGGSGGALNSNGYGGGGYIGGSAGGGNHGRPGEQGRGGAAVQVISGGCTATSGAGGQFGGGAGMGSGSACTAVGIGPHGGGGGGGGWWGGSGGLAGNANGHSGAGGSSWHGGAVTGGTDSASGATPGAPGHGGRGGAGQGGSGTTAATGGRAILSWSYSP